MSGIDLTTAEAKLATWLAAEEKIADNQSYQVAGRTYTRADLADVQKQIDYWDRKVQRLSSGGMRVRGGTPVR